MPLRFFLRAASALLGCLLLASCASGPQPNTDPRAWSFSPMIEARHFYASGLSVQDYVQTKPLGGGQTTNVFFLCHGFIEAGDEIRAEQCRQLFERMAAEPQNKPHAQTFAFYREALHIYAQQLLLEQSRFAEVEKNLTPYFEREAALFTFNMDKGNNYRLRMIAAPILARAQRNLGGISEPVRRTMAESSGGAMAIMGAVMNPKGMAIVVAEREYLLGNHAACYQKVARDSTGGIGVISLLSAPLDQMYEGSATALQRMMDVHYVRLQALCAYEAGKHEEARLSYEELLKLEDVQALKGLRRVSHYHLALIALKRGQRAEAITHLQASIKALEAERAAIDSEAGRLGYVVNKSDIYLQMVALLVEEGRDAEAFEYAERGKSRALIDMLATRRSGQGTVLDSKGTFSQALARLNDAEASQNGIELAGSPSNRRNLSIRPTLASHDANLRSLIAVTVLSAGEVQQQLRPQETLLEYFGDKQRLFAFVVTKNQIKALRLDAAAANSLSMDWRHSLADVKTQAHLTHSQRLHEVLLAPALPYFSTGPITIVPHGALHYIPFAALHNGQRFLIQAADLRLLPSASVLPLLGSGKPGGRGLLILGNPDLDDKQLDLPGAEQEARGIQRMNPGSLLLLRKGAAETALRRLGPQHGEIHFAMHGKFDAQQPLSSGLYMAKDAENDGILTVRELYDLQLNVNLVVLSACETALGETAKGDDIVGLNRGFLFAGAHSIVSSLWEVDDNATRDLMLAFYKQREKNGKAGALRQAQLATLKKYPHPYYWAAFQISGMF
ncbi:MAG: CHAT domain-containing protein [Curvibacter sp.]